MRNERNIQSVQDVPDPLARLACDINELRVDNRVDEMSFLEARYKRLDSTSTYTHR